MWPQKFMTLRIYSLALVLWLALLLPAWAQVQLIRPGKKPLTFRQVYQRQEALYLPVMDVLRGLELSGYWQPVKHRYVISSKRGNVHFYPQGKYLHTPQGLRKLRQPPRFINEKLHVGADFVRHQLSWLVDMPLQVHRPQQASSKTAADAENVYLSRLVAAGKRTAKPQRLGRILLDPGHGGGNIGCVGASGVLEKDLVLGFSRLLAQQLEMQLGSQVILTRDGDYTVSVPQRRKQAQQGQFDLVLLLHAQAAVTSGPHGVDIFIAPKEAQAASAGLPARERLGLYISGALRDAGFHVRGVRSASLYPFPPSGPPSVMLEIGFLTHPAEEKRLVQRQYQKSLAQKIVAGVRRFARFQSQGANVK